MDDVPRLNEVPLVHERGFTVPPTVDANLRDRIRSLLISRNRQQPPRTPCPSPDYSYLPRSPEEKSSSTSPVHARKYKFSPAQTIAKLVRLEYEELDMGATRFDGPAGQIEKDDADVMPRRPSQPNMEEARNTRAEWAWSRPTAGLDYRAEQNVLGRESLIPTSPKLGPAKSSASKKANKSRLPRFYLRTVPPATDVNKIARPKPQHIPGSYRSEVDTKRVVSSRVDTPLIDDLPDAMRNDVLAVPTYTGLRDEHGHNAVGALHEIKGQDHHAVPSEDLRSAPTSPMANSIAVLDDDHGKAHVDALEAPIFIIGGDHEEDNLKQGELTDDLANPEVEAVPQERGQISELLAQSPLSESHMKEQVTEDYLFAGGPVKDKRTPSSVYSTSVGSLKSIKLEADQVADQVKSPLLPTTSPQAPNNTEPAVPVAELPLIQSTKSTPDKTQKPSPVSRAMSLLSEMSARSGIQAPSLRSFRQQMKSGSPNLTSRPHRHRKRTSGHSGQQRAEIIANRRGYRPLQHVNRREYLGETDSTNGAVVLQNQYAQGEGFAKVISDLEGLLKEALNLAGHATSIEQSEEVPLTRQHRRRDYELLKRTESGNSSECASSLSGGADEEDNYTTLPHQSAGKHHGHFSGDKPENDKFHHGHFKKARDATQCLTQTRYSSTIPYEEENQAKVQPEGTTSEFLELPHTSSKMGVDTQQSSFYRPSTLTDWAVIRIPSKMSKVRLEMGPTPSPPQAPPIVQVPPKEQHVFLQRGHGPSESGVTRESIREYVNAHQRPPIEPRISSIRPKQATRKRDNSTSMDEYYSSGGSDCTCAPYFADFKASALHYHPVYRAAMASETPQAPRSGPHPIRPRQDTADSLEKHHNVDTQKHRPKRSTGNQDYSLENRNHLSIREPRGFSLSRSHRRSPIARDWSTSRKRYVAIVACITTAFMGLIVGIYAGEVPAIQYAIADEHHYTILGNVLFFLGLAITTALFYPLPLLHGRKPYTLAALTILLPLQFPQALAMNSPRTPTVATYRIGLLLPRIFAGMVMGFANINLITTLLDLFGASLQSGNPHQEIVNENDVRRHGGGMGVWLGIWTFCAIGSIGIGFLIGAGIISGLDVSWGFWITIIINAAVLLLNIVTPETRRSAYRRSMAEVRNGNEISRRVARGEIKMHLQSTGPIWWGEEVFAGHVLAIRMLKQPGFIVLSLYLGWIYGQVVLVIVVRKASSILILVTHSCIASRSPVVEVLFLSSPICWIGCGNHTHRFPVSNPFSESLLVQPITTPSSKDR